MELKVDKNLKRTKWNEAGGEGEVGEAVCGLMRMEEWYSR